MTVKHMKIFAAVYQTGNMTKAAQQLYMTQPAVTKAIRELENYYGVKLFERLSQGLSVTEAGKEFYAYAVHIIESFDHMEQSLRDWEELGRIRIGASATLGTMFLPGVLREMKERHPGLQVQAVVSTGVELQHLLERNELDVALIEGRITGEHLQAEAFLEDRLVLIVPPNGALSEKSEITLAEAASYPQLLRDKDSVSRILLDQIYAMHHLSVTPMMESFSPEALIRAVHEGLGVSFLPELLVRDAVAAGEVRTVAVSDADLMRENYIVYHKNKLLTGTLRELIELCRK